LIHREESTHYLHSQTMTRSGGMPDHNVDLFCQLELKEWIRDAFAIEGERMTSALTLSCLFNAKPGAMVQKWGDLLN